MANDILRLKNFFILIFLCCSAFILNAQNMTRIRGTVKDDKTNEPLPFVNITFVGKPNIGVTTDFDGQYDLQSEWGTDRISFQYLGYEKQIKTIEPGKSQTVDIRLKQTTQQLKEVVVKGSKR